MWYIGDGRLGSALLERRNHGVRLTCWLVVLAGRAGLDQQKTEHATPVLSFGMHCFSHHVVVVVVFLVCDLIYNNAVGFEKSFANHSQQPIPSVLSPWVSMRPIGAWPCTIPLGKERCRRFFSVCMCITRRFDSRGGDRELYEPTTLLCCKRT